VKVAGLEIADRVLKEKQMRQYEEYRT